MVAITTVPNVQAGEPPVLTDSRLELTLFAEDPDIVTPIGMVVDDQDQVFVIESHTHHPPSDYKGPASDRIKIFRDEDNDGIADSVTVFADGLHQAMNLARSPDGKLYVVCAREVLRLDDEDDDARCDRKTRILRLETKQRYAHNSLLGITFDRDGWMYLARGNTGSDFYRLEGHDGSAVEGYGDGGNVIRCRPDGSRLSEFATGFWNPFDLNFDSFGRLLLVDNDPDARGPNRLVHVVEGGDYGYRSLFGGAGTHPFQGWDGSLPGTLPYIAGTGEAPSGLIDATRTCFPPDYRNAILATIWNENSIERFDLDPANGNLLQKTKWISGGQDFRPVAMDCDRHGNLFITDWVLVDYPNHGRGRIWRVAPTAGGDKMKPRGSFDAHQPHDMVQRMQALRTAGRDRLRRVLRDRATDPMVRHAAIMRLSDDDLSDLREECLADNGALALAGLLATKRSDPLAATAVRDALSAGDVRVRIAALRWAAETLELSLVSELRKAIEVSPVTPELFECFLAASEVLEPNFVKGFQSRLFGKANRIPRRLDPSLLVGIATSSELASSARALAIERLGAEAYRAHAKTLIALADPSDDEISQAVFESDARHSKDPSLVEARFQEIARDRRWSVRIRTGVIAMLANLSSQARVTLAADDPEPRVALQIERSRRTIASSSPSHDANRPKSKEEWHQVLAEGGNAMLGRHVFQSRRVGCSRCHQAGGSGGKLGPGLSGLAQSKSRRQIIDAILDPFTQIAHARRSRRHDDRRRVSRFGCVPGFDG